MFIGAVVDSIGVENENIARTHQCNLADIGRVELFLSEIQGIVFLAIRMICRNLEAERKELHHAALIDVHELAVLGREHQGWRMPEIHEAKTTAWADFAVQHGCDFARFFLLTDSQSVAGSDGLRQSQVEVFQEVRRYSSVSVKFGKHQSMEGIVNRGCNLGGDDSVSLRVHHQNTRRRIKLTQLSASAHLLGTPRESILRFHLWSVSRGSRQPLHMIINRIA